MKNGNGKITLEDLAWVDEITRIGRNAVRKAREENRRLGLANVDGRDGKLIFEMPDGSIVVKEARPGRSGSATKILSTVNNREEMES